VQALFDVLYSTIILLYQLRLCQFYELFSYWSKSNSGSIDVIGDSVRGEFLRPKFEGVNTIAGLKQVCLFSFTPTHML
jgi:hypothetical protein